jgi:hypothetical protein
LRMAVFGGQGLRGKQRFLRLVGVAFQVHINSKTPNAE